MYRIDVFSRSCARDCSAPSGISITVIQASLDLVTQAIAQIAAQACPTAAQLFTRKDVPNTEKWDWVLPDELFLAGYRGRELDLDAAHALCIKLYEI
jgi:hypothetical protein